MQYWVYVGFRGRVNLHMSSCAHYENRPGSDNLRDPYDSRGAAIDAVLSLDKKP